MADERDQGYNYSENTQNGTQSSMPRRRRSARYEETEPVIQEQIDPQERNIMRSTEQRRDNSGILREQSASFDPESGINSAGYKSAQMQNEPVANMLMKRSATDMQHSVGYAAGERKQASRASRPASATEHAGKKTGSKKKHRGSAVRRVVTAVAAVIVVAVAVFLLYPYVTNHNENRKETASVSGSELNKSVTPIVEESKTGNKTWNGKTVKVGDHVFFGSYEQDDNWENGPESIEWIVLSMDDDSMTILSQYGLWAERFNTKRSSSPQDWRTSSLREWLNDTFFTTAFSEKEQEEILYSYISNDEHNYTSTTDNHVYLLSVNEVKRIFGDEKQRLCELTEYAKAYTSAEEGDNGYYSWWTRTASSDPNELKVSIVNNMGEIAEKSPSASSRAIRPVIRIMLDNHPMKDNGLEEIVGEDGKTRYKRGRLTYEILEDDTVNILSYAIAKESGFIIPDSIDGHPVSSLGERSIGGSITSITIPGYIKTIGDRAFEDSTYLTEINIEEGVEYIGDYAFAKTALREVQIPASVSHIGVNPFKNCEKLRAISVSPDNKLFYSSDGVLYDTENQRLITYPLDKASFKMPDGVREIGDEAFYNSQIREVKLPDTVISIGKQSFTGCNHLYSISLPSNFSHMDDTAFNYCNVKIMYIQSDSKVFKADGMAVYNTEEHKLVWFDRATTAGGSLWEEYTIWEDTVAMSEFAFQHVQTVDRVTLSGNMKEIPAGAFFASRLLEVTLPEGIEKIEEQAFRQCRLKKIILPEGLKSIGDYAFYSCENLADITLPDGLEEIGEHAFESCDSIPSMRIPGTVKEIGVYTFRSCDMISSISLTDGVTTIPEGFCEFCEELKELIIPQSVTLIEELDFRDNDLCYAVVQKGSYAEKYCKENSVRYKYETDV